MGFVVRFVPDHYGFNHNGMPTSISNPEPPGQPTSVLAHPPSPRPPLPLRERIEARVRHTSFIIIPANGHVDRARPARQRSMPTEEHLGFRMIHNIESGAAQHRFHAGAIWNPPVGRIAAVTFFDQIHLWKTWPFEHVRFRKFIIVLEQLNRFASTLEGLKNEEIGRDVLVNQVEREQRMAQMIKNPEK